MIYTSKRNKFKNFIKTNNMKYYAFVLVLLIVFITVFVIILKKNKVINIKNDEITSTSAILESTTQETVEADYASGKYRLDVNLASNFITIYKWNENKSEYNSIPYKYMMCSSADSINVGNYSGSDKSVRELWHSDNDIFYRYYVEFSDGISFHSSAYEKKNDASSLSSESYSKFGSGLSETGITLLLADAKWIYENCSYESDIEIYENNEPIPADAAYWMFIPLPDGVCWDPTDQSRGTPWCNRIADSIIVPDTLTFDQNVSDEYVLSFAKATDPDGNDISSFLYITGKPDTWTEGQYNITYNIIDLYGNHLTKDVLVTISGASVNESASETGSEAAYESDSASMSDTSVNIPEQTGNTQSEQLTEPSVDISTTAEVLTEAVWETIPPQPSEIDSSTSQPESQENETSSE